MTDRSIPHLRDIFGFHGNHWGSSNNNNQSRHNNDDLMADQLKGLRLLDNATDSAISSIGSTSEDEYPRSTATSNKKKKQRSRRENSKTLTEKDVKHLERHLSMKKTIRKKIMRDLQQAFVEDPNEFRVEDISHEQLKAEINIQSLSFGPQKNQKTGKKTGAQEPSFLDMLRGGATNVPPPGGRGTNDDDEDSGHGSPTRELSTERVVDYNEDEDDASKKTSFWRRFTMKGRNKR